MIHVRYHDDDNDMYPRLHSLIGLTCLAHLKTFFT